MQEMENEQSEVQNDSLVRCCKSDIAESNAPTSQALGFPFIRWSLYRGHSTIVGKDKTEPCLNDRLDLQAFSSVASSGDHCHQPSAVALVSCTGAHVFAPFFAPLPARVMPPAEIFNGQQRTVEPASLVQQFESFLQRHGRVHGGVWKFCTCCQRLQTC